MRRSAVDAERRPDGGRAIDRRRHRLSIRDDGEGTECRRAAIGHGQESPMEVQAMTNVERMPVRRARSTSPGSHIRCAHCHGRPITIARVRHERLGDRDDQGKRQHRRDEEA